MTTKTGHRFPALQNISEKDVYIKNGRIERIDNSISVKEKVSEINGEGRHLFPGVIDDQVHFREPGLTHKANIYTESKAAVAGGVTSFMEMPNTIPNALTHELLENKYNIAKQTSLANYSFFMGVSNSNADEVLKMNKRKNDVCGVKIFMGSSTGNMLVDSEPALHKIFSESESWLCGLSPVHENEPGHQSRLEINVALRHLFLRLFLLPK